MNIIIIYLIPCEMWLPSWEMGLISQECHVLFETLMQKFSQDNLQYTCNILLDVQHI